MKLILFGLTASTVSHGFQEVDGKTIAKDANKIIGTKYIYGGNSNTKGLDCSALVKNIYSKYGYKIPRKASWQVQDTKYCPTYNDLYRTKVGDALYFKNKKEGIHHTAIITGYDYSGVPIITHAKGKKFGVVRETMSQKYMNELCGIKRFYECTSPLTGNYTEQELAAQMLLAAKQYGVDAESLFHAVWEISEVSPLLITINKAKNKNMNLPLLFNLSADGISLFNEADDIIIKSDTIKTAKIIISGLYQYGYSFRVGLMQIEVDELSYDEVVGLVYPQQNFNLADENKIRNCINTEDFKRCYYR